MLCSSRLKTFDLRFWAGGRRAALDALRAEFAARIAELERRHATADEAERTRLVLAVAQAREELARRERALAFGLFGAG